MSDVEELSLADCEFYSGLLAGQQVVLTRSELARWPRRLPPPCCWIASHRIAAINTGSAGGFDPELHIGDVVISSEVRHHDVDVTGFGYEIGQVPQMPAAFIADERLKALARAAVAELQEGIQSKEGLICTGDQFMCDPERIAAPAPTSRPWPPEMEGAAIAQVCHQFGVPFVVTRSRSPISPVKNRLTLLMPI